LRAVPTLRTDSAIACGSEPLVCSVVPFRTLCRLRHAVGAIVTLRALDWGDSVDASVVASRALSSVRKLLCTCQAAIRFCRSWIGCSTCGSRQTVVSCRSHVGRDVRGSEYISIVASWDTDAICEHCFARGRIVCAKWAFGTRTDSLSSILARRARISRMEWHLCDSDISCDNIAYESSSAWRYVCVCCSIFCSIRASCAFRADW